MDSACTGEPVIVTPTYSSDVFNIIWSTPGAANFYSGLNAVTVNPSDNNFCLVAKAIATPSGCATVDTLCIAIRPDCKLVAVGVACDADSTYMGDSITVNVLGYDTIPAANDTIVTLSALPLNGTAVVNGNNTITYKPGANFSGFEEFSYEVCVVINNYKICDTAGVCITVVDTNIACFIPNGFSPNGDGVHDLYVVPCNDGFPASELRVFDRWGMEVWRSDGHYLNDWDGRNKQGTVLPDATYYVIYYYNNGTNKAVATYVTIMR
jgi:gliding motility-associated-like protein